MTTNNLIEISIMVILFCLMIFFIKSLNYVIVFVKNETSQISIDPILKNVPIEQHQFKKNIKTIQFAKNKITSLTKTNKRIIKNIGGT
jgi:preprotein translocase subunit SecF